MEDIFCSSFVTVYGIGKIYTDSSAVTEIELPWYPTNKTEQIQYNSSALSESVAQRLSSYYLGEKCDLSDIPVNYGNITPFRKSVFEMLRTIPYGCICSYRQLAVMCGSPDSARAVGGALASNRMPLIIPCHRITGASGKLTGFTAPGGIEAKMALLKVEGIVFNGSLVVKNQLVMHSMNFFKK